MRSFAFVLAACVILAGCGSSGTPSGPRGWKQTAPGDWISPRNAQERFRVAAGSFSGTLKDLASQTTTDVILQQNVKYRSGVPFSRCPGEAGLQTFASKSGDRLVQAAFSVQNGQKVTAEYIRPAHIPDDPAAIEALAANVCVAP